MFYLHSFAINQECGKAKVRTRIVGGKEADPFAYPWTVALKNGLNHVGTYCVGTLISSRHILTAAHCVQGEGGSGDSLDLSRFRMAFGMHRQSDGEQLLLNVSKPPIVHPLFKRLPYTGSMIYDLALLVLDADVPLSEKVLPICLYPEQIHESRELDWDYDDSLQDPNDDGSRAYTINKIRRLSEQRFQKQLEQLQLAKKSNESDDTNRVSARSAVRTIKSIDVEEDEMVSFYIQPLQPTVENSVKGADEGRMSELTVAGWGTDDADQVRMVDTLKEAIISERPDIWCIDDFGSDAFSSKIQICGHGFGKKSLKNLFIQLSICFD